MVINYYNNVMCNMLHRGWTRLILVIRKAFGLPDQPVVSKDFSLKMSSLVHFFIYVEPLWLSITDQPLRYAVRFSSITSSFILNILFDRALVINLASQLLSIIGLQFLMSLMSFPFLF